MYCTSSKVLSNSLAGFRLPVLACIHKQSGGAQWLSGRVLDSRQRGCGFEPHRRHFVVSLSKTHLSLLNTGSTQKGPSWHNWKIVDWDVKNQIKQTKTNRVENSVYPDQLALEASWSGSTQFLKYDYPGLAGKDS